MKNKRIKLKILGIFLTLTGMITIIAWMPVWVWLVLLGLGLIYLGILFLSNS